MQPQNEDFAARVAFQLALIGNVAVFEKRPAVTAADCFYVQHRRCQYHVRGSFFWIFTNFLYFLKLFCNIS